MRLVETISNNANTTSYIWGGFTIDVYLGCIIREHHDLDYLTVNLATKHTQISQLFNSYGWETKKVINGDLKATKNDIEIHLGNIQINEVVTWTHNGNLGAISFPNHWLNSNPVNFLDVKVHVVEPEFEYAIKNNPHLLNPSWQPREKDLEARQHLKKILEMRHVKMSILHKLVTENA